MLNKKLKLLRAKWEQEDIELSPPKSEKQILKSFQEVDKLISEDVLEFYRIVGGMVENEWDSEFISFWSIEQIVKENSKIKSELILFADFLIFSHCWGFKFENQKSSSVYIDYFSGENRLEKIADSIEEFVDLYLVKPNNIICK